MRCRSSAGCRGRGVCSDFEWTFELLSFSSLRRLCHSSCDLTAYSYSFDNDSFITIVFHYQS